MKTSEKALIQNPEGRGFMKLGNHSGEITYNVALGINNWGVYKMLGQLKFDTVEDAKDYVLELGATEMIMGQSKGKEYYAITKQDGCAFMSIGFYSVK